MKGARGLGARVEAHYKDRANLHRILELGQFVQATTALVHEIQRERGLSSGWVASEGGRFGPDLQAQRARTDAALGHAIDAWELRDRDKVVGTLDSTLTLARQDLAALTGLRAEVDALAIPTASTVASYTGLVDRLLALVAEAPGTSPHPQVTLAIIALFQFVLAKEFTGQERALGSAVCAQGEFEPFQAEQLERVDRRRQEALEVFARHATADQLAGWEALASEPCFSSLADLRKALGAAAAETGPVPAPEDWFARSTAVIDRLRTLEVTLLEDLDQLCLQVLAEARSAWEDRHETPEAREALVLRRLERTQARLLTERQAQRRGRPNAPVAGPEADLAAGSGRAVESAHRLTRDLDRLADLARTLEGLSRQARVLSLDAKIQAIRRHEVAEGALALGEALTEAVRQVEETRRILQVSTGRALEAFESFHSTVLGSPGPEREKS